LFFSVSANTVATDKEMTVKIRSNSHYRNSALRAVKSECLSARACEGLLGKEECRRWKKRGRAGCRSFSIEGAPRGALLLYPFENKKRKG
jgi:hypothetical protein